MIRTKNIFYRRVLAFLLSVAVIFGGMTIPAAALPTVAGEYIITDFKELPREVLLQTVELGTLLQDLELPKTLTVTVEMQADEDSQTASPSEAENEGSTVLKKLSVQWITDPVYDPETTDTYMFTPILPEVYVVAEGISLPSVRITVEPVAGVPALRQALLTREDSIINVGDSTTASGTNWTYKDNLFTVTGDVTLTGETSENYVKVASGTAATITLNEVEIDASNIHDKSALDLSEAGKTTIILIDSSTLKSGNDKAGIFVPDDRRLIINGEGSLTAVGGRYGAGIGAGYGYFNTKHAYGGNVTINSGTVIAIGGESGAGIGGSFGGTASKPPGKGGTTIINGGMVTAIGNGGGAGIGGGINCMGGTTTISGGSVMAQGSSGGAGIGGGNNGMGGTTTISGGEVTAIGGGLLFMNTGGKLEYGGGAGIGGGLKGAGGTISISGGMVTAIGTSGKDDWTSNAAGIGHGSNSEGGKIIINGGSVKAEGGFIMSPEPQNMSGEKVYLAKLEEQSDVESVSVDHQSFWIAGAHENDDSLYLYLSGTDHQVDVQTSNGIKRYISTWGSASNDFTFDSGEVQESRADTSVSLALSEDCVEYSTSSAVTVTAVITDLSIASRNSRTSLGMARLDQVAFYLEDETEPFALASVIDNESTATLDISGWNPGEYSIKARYGGSFGGKVSEDTQTLTIKKISLTRNDLNYTIPTGHTYNGFPQGIGDISSNIPEAGIVTVKYDGDSAPPLHAGDYAVTAELSGGTNYQAESISLGTYTIAKKDLIISTVSVPDSKVYDGDVKLSADNVTFTGIISGEILTKDRDYTITGTYRDRNAGEDKPVTVTVTLSPTPSAENYHLPENTITAVSDISQRIITDLVSIALTNGKTADKLVPGDILRVNTLLLNPADPMPAYKWYRDGEQLPGQTDGFYALTETDLGKIISVEVTGTGNYSGTKTETIPVPEAAPAQPSPVQPNHETADDSENKSGNQRGGSQNNSPTATSITVIPQVKDGNAVLTITQAMVKAAIDEAVAAARAKSNTESDIHMNISVTAVGASRFSLTVERTALNQLLESGVKSFAISSLPVNMNFDMEALKQLHGQSNTDISITASPVTVAGLHTAFDITISSIKDGVSIPITSLGTGTATLGILVKPGSNEWNSGFYGAYVTPDNQIIPIADAVYHADSRRMILSVKHFYVYGAGSADTVKRTYIN